MSDEFDLIRWIRRQVEGAPNLPIGPGDDCAGLALPEGTTTLVTTDMVIDGIHFRMDEVEPRQVGRKAVARGLSDIAAMAGDAAAIVVAVAAPRHLSISWLQDLVRGIVATADELGVVLAGGDVATGDLPLTITVTCMGSAPEGASVRRNGALPTDMLLVTGELGGSLLGRHLEFSPRLREGRWLREQVDLHAMIDISDGLAADANHLAAESGVAIEIWGDQLPVSRDAVNMAERSGKPAVEHALFDGEDYELLFTLGAREAAALVHRDDLPVPITCIGEVSAGAGLWIRGEGKERRPLDPRGWKHALGE